MDSKKRFYNKEFKGKTVDEIKRLKKELKDSQLELEIKKAFTFSPRAMKNLSVYN